ncbi:tetratricopeptide repeat protein [Herbihabitans rhizosphaerae]|uniref:tetratricopeptide repeat protein n=1 Tax=Herbihabitans rhizosphaerae TaxID=1872711 RepID=UPI00102BCD8E|nr:tetratricopeptide repeat protein [Herbihabitans rhizosphaerae]
MSVHGINDAARRHGIGYSTLRSWRTGVHLPRVPEDNPPFAAFLREVAVSESDARVVFELAKTGWRQVVHANRSVPAACSTAVAAGSSSPSDADHHLSDGDRAALRSLCECPCRELTVGAIAAMVDRPVDSIRGTLARLHRAGLVSTGEYERHRVPDAVREFRRRQVRDRCDEPTRRAARLRLAEFYVRTAMAAARQLYPDLLELVPPPVSGPTVGFGTDRAAARWLAAEHGNVVDIAITVLEYDRELTWSLADALRAIQQVRPHSLDWTPIAETALFTADDPEIRAGLQMAAGMADWGVGGLDAATSLFTEAAAVWRELNRPRELCAALQALGAAQYATSNHRGAYEHCEQALRIRRQLSERRGQASTLVFLADICSDLGRLEVAEGYAELAVTHASRLNYSAGVAGALGSRGRILLHRGEHDKADACFERQLALSESLDFGSRQAVALFGRAMVCLRREHFGKALDLAGHAARIAADSGNAVTLTDAWNVTGAAHFRRGGFTESAACHRRALAAARTSRYRRGRQVALNGLVRALGTLPEVSAAQ